MDRMNENVSASLLGCLGLLEEENERIRREMEEEERLQREETERLNAERRAAELVRSEDGISPEIRSFCRWVIEQYYLAIEDPEWVTAVQKYKEVLATEGEAAAEAYIPPFKTRHKEKRVPAGTGTLSCKSAEKSKVKNSAKKIIPQSI